ncbi:MFS transporter [Subtercola sp. PAMC28395]|uniref:MFS transporter n=1 Tax=Subtercola sp. PAMC28395 TaxID=2846775 RepID=UPI001C0B7A00|nr:MFS transporter [Subtercola sp. PAMC28395]QWT24058.1 MFS transporter [Subtercola sp. PAMC28395]
MAQTITRSSRRGSFWASAAVLALCLWSSGAPSVLYPTYAAEWHLTSTVITTIFATYPVVLLGGLLVVGNISDSIGRRQAMLIGIGLILVSGVIFAFAPNVGWLYAGRALQGMGTAFALGAASASLVENNTSSNARLASSLTTASTALGLTLALLVSGTLAQYAVWPQGLSFLVLSVLSAVVFAVVFVMPADAEDARPAWRPQPIRVPRGTVRVFVAATLSVSLAYSVGAVFLSLGASIARDLAETTDLLVVGLLLAVSSVMIGATAIALQRIHTHIAVILGALLSLAGLTVLEIMTRSGSIGLFLVWCVVGGAGYSLAFMGGLQLIGRTSLLAHRGATLSALYLFSYVFQALTAIGAGALATALGLAASIEIIVPLVGVLALASGVFAAVDWHRRTRSTAAVA